MSWTVVAWKDFQDAVRSRTLWALAALFGLLSVGIAVAYGFVDELGGSGIKGLILFVSGSVSLFVSITAVVICYRAIAGEREDGSIKLLLALPHTRRDVLLGKVVGRTAVLAVPAIGSLLLGLAVGSALTGSVAVGPTVAFVALTLVYVLTYVAVVVGLSATTGSTTRAAALGVGVFLVFEVLWEIVGFVALFVASGFDLSRLATPAGYPDWYFLVTQVPPSTAYTTVLNELVPGSVSVGGVGGGTGGVAPSAGQVDAFFGTPWLGAVVLGLWLVVPLAVGYWRFARADL